MNLGLLFFPTVLKILYFLGKCVRVCLTWTCITLSKYLKFISLGCVFPGGIAARNCKVRLQHYFFSEVLQSQPWHGKPYIPGTFSRALEFEASCEISTSFSFHYFFPPTTEDTNSRMGCPSKVASSLPSLGVLAPCFVLRLFFLTFLTNKSINEWKRSDALPYASTASQCYWHQLWPNVSRTSTAKTKKNGRKSARTKRAKATVLTTYFVFVSHKKMTEEF